MGKTCVGVLILAAIFVGIIVNSIFLDKALDEICASIIFAEQLALDGKYEEAAYAAEEAAKLWGVRKNYFRCFIYHNKTDSAAKLLREMVFALENGSVVDFAEIYEELDELSQSEKIVFEWIL